MKAGKLRHKAQFQRATDARDSRGSVTQTWTTYAHAWIGYEVDSGGEGPNAGKREATQMMRFQARFIDGVKTTDRFVVYDRIFEILSAFDPDGRRRELSGTCREVLNG